jgi:D-glycerate 3-kinase
VLRVLLNTLADALRAAGGPPGAVDTFHLPVATWLLGGLTPGTPRIVGVNGPQGAGKSTLCAALVRGLGAVGVRTIALSVDDLYLPHADQRALAAAHPGDRTLELRGYPGTHDVALGEATLRSLRAGARTRLPAYDKSAFAGRGDRVPEARWRVEEGACDLVLFEGWMLGFAPVPEPPPELAASNALLGRYAAWHAHLDATILLLPPSLPQIVEWRVDSERARRERGEGALSGAEARDYAERFLPAYRAWLPGLHRAPPGRAALSIQLGPDRLPLR